MAKTKKIETEIETGAIDTHEAFNEALLEAQANIVDNPYPTIEVTDRLFQALAKGRSADSMTYGDPGVRIFKVGKMDQILKEESMTADQHRELEIRRFNQQVANK